MAGLNRVHNVVRALLLVAACIYLAMYVLVALDRISYPFELEWREGGAVDHVIRILEGQKLYVSPSLEFVPYTYTPLFFYLSAAVAKIAGAGFFPLRLVSFSASLGVFLLIFLIVKRETGRSFYGFLSAGLFAATYRFSGAWFDIARVDSLFLVLMLAAIYLVKFGGSRLAYVLAGGLLALSFLAKQTALAMSLPLLLYGIFFRRRRAVYLIGTAVILVAGSTFVLNSIHDGWYYYYVFVSPRQHSIVESMITGFWTQDMLSLFVAFVFAAVYLFTEIRQKDKGNFVFYLLLLGAGLGSSWLSRLSNGGYNNALLPAYCMLCVLFGLGLHKIVEIIRTLPEDRQTLMRIYVFFICIIQFATLRYDPIAQIPTSADMEAGNRIIETLTRVAGDVFIPSHGYLPVLAGKKSYSSGMAFFDMQGEHGAAKAGLTEEIRLAIAEKKFDAILVDAPSSWFTSWFPEVHEYYPVQETILDDPGVFWPVTGMKTRPEILCTVGEP